MKLNLNFDILDEPIELYPVSSLVIENKTIFAKLIQSLFNYNEDTLDVRIFDNQHNPLKKHELMLVTDILSYNVNTAATLKMIYSDLELQISQDPASKTAIEDMLGNVLIRINRELLDFPLDLSVSEISIQGALKALDVRIETSGETIFERVFDIVQICKYLPKKSLLVFVNLSTYLSQQELDRVVEYALLQKINMLLLDNAIFDMPSDAMQFVIDHDFILLKNT